MSTIKSFTDIQQSRKLAEFLPLESADMLFQLGEDKYADSIRVPLTKKHWEQMMPDINPCWSLAALLKVISNIFKYNLDYNGISFILTVGDFEVSNIIAVDACYEMILKLHKFNLL